MSHDIIQAKVDVMGLHTNCPQCNARMDVRYSDFESMGGEFTVWCQEVVPGRTIVTRCNYGFIVTAPSDAEMAIGLTHEE